ncbi:NAD-binding protein [Maridesulfovibrio sp.]|uniref:NAD-binding protein n=1 Tax=Maridesulfovibrio sp. TaxID=2795000 RepID=UPI002A18907D|nr:NAD-binding protein [Maridesulfovibrio sp.]
MKLLLCGAGRTARELLRLLGDDWEVTLVDKSREEIERTAAISSEIKDIHVEDATSQVVLEKVGVKEFDYVIALTDDDRTNNIIAELASEAGVRYVTAFVRDSELASALRKNGVNVIQLGKLAAGQLYHYLQDPRMRVTPLNLGPANVMEIKASEHLLIIGKRAGYLRRKGMRLVAVFREENLIFPKPDTLIRSEDRLVIIGDSSVFQSVCGLLECDNPHFPLAYGPGLLVVMKAEKESDGIAAEVNEALYLAQNTQIKSVTLLNAAPEEKYLEYLGTWPQNLSVGIETMDGPVPEIIRRNCRESNYGLVVTAPFDAGLLKAFGKPSYISLAHDIGRPILISKGSAPYERFLVPFNGSAMAELAVEVAVDIQRQMGGEISIAVVEEPEFITGDGTSGWQEKVVSRATELGHIYKTKFDLITRKGNPVREIAALSSEYDLMIVGSTNRDRSLLTPNIGENLVAASKCSVLLTAF